MESVVDAAFVNDLLLKNKRWKLVLKNITPDPL
jgi:hypothetical protein